MAIREELQFDLSKAIAQIDELERQLDSLLQPVTIPVRLDDSQVSSAAFDRAEASTRDLREELQRTDREMDDLGRSTDETAQGVLRLGTRGASVFTTLRGSIVGIGAAFAAFQGGQALLDFFQESIGAASDLQESTSKAQVVFGSFFDDIQNFASTAPQALGLANQQALEFTATFGNLFTALGLSQQAAADLAPEIVQLGADLASFNNIDVNDALEKLRAGLVGEAEPLRTLGVNLTAATVAAKAVELGIADSTAAVSEAAKVQARYALIVEQTATAQGDFARTADGIANKQRTLAAEFENFRASVGEALLPLFDNLLDAAPAFLDSIEKLVPAISSFANALLKIDFATPISGLTDFIIAGQEAFRFFTGDFFGFTISKQLQDFDASLQKGVAPAKAFEATLADLFKTTNRDLNTEEVTRFVGELQDFARLDTGGITQVLTNLLRAPNRGGLAEGEFQALVAALKELLGLADALPPPVDEVRNAIEEVGPGAQRTAVALTDFGQSLSRLVSQDLDLSGQVARIQSSLAELPTTLSAAAAALKDSEGDIITDFSDFLANIDEEIAARATFRRNIALLHVFGLDLLAETFADAGLDAAQALADAVANPEEAALAEQKLQAAAKQQAREFATAFGTTVGQELANLSPPEIEVIPVLGALDTSGLNFLNINVGAGAPGFGGGEPATVINQNFYDTPAPTTSTARAAQSASSIVSRT